MGLPLPLPLPLPRRCCNCGDPVTMSYLGGHGRAAAEDREEPPSWASHLAAADFSKPCSRDRVCDTCGGAAFCGHCCEEHHRGHVTSPAPTNDDATDHRRDSFCTGCGVAFSSELCAHHGVGHEVIPVDEYEGWHCARCTGSERWFPVVFAGIQTFQDNEGNLLVPLHRKPAAVAKPVKDEPCPPPWMFELVTADFAKTCARDRVCSTCGGAAFCGHCCGEHHPGHDTAASTPGEKDVSEAAVVHRRDSFCTACRVAFCSDLCAHHASGEGHEVISIDEFIEWHCVRCTGSEWWFPALHYMLMLAFDDEHGNVFVPLQWIEKVEDGEELPSWMTHLVTADFSKMCTRDRVCNTCGGAGFCEHCCGEHHRGHDTSAATTNGTEGSVAPAEGYRRDSFCTICGVGFCSELCAHHAGGEGHEVIPVDVYGDRHFLRCTGSEPWFASAFGDVETYEDKDGNLMVPQERKRSMILEPGLRYATRHCGGTTVPPAAANPFDF